MSWKHLRQQIELLTMIMKSATIGNLKPKVVEGFPPQERKKYLEILLRKGFRGQLKGKGPLKPGQKPNKCYRCDGWGHGWRECPTPENLNWGQLVGAIVSSTPRSLGSTPTPIPNQNP